MYFATKPYWLLVVGTPVAVIYTLGLLTFVGNLRFVEADKMGILAAWNAAGLVDREVLLGIGLMIFIPAFVGTIALGLLIWLLLRFPTFIGLPVVILVVVLLGRLLPQLSGFLVLHSGLLVGAVIILLTWLLFGYLLRVLFIEPDPSPLCRKSIPSRKRRNLQRRVARLLTSPRKSL